MENTGRKFMQSKLDIDTEITEGGDSQQSLQESSNEDSPRKHYSSYYNNQSRSRQPSKN